MNFDELFFFLVPRRFMVYWIPIRVYRNHADKGVRFPRWQPMRLKVSLLMPVFGKEMQDFVGQIALPIGGTRKGHYLVWLGLFHHSIFIIQFSSLITHHPSLIIHHSKFLNFHSLVFGYCFHSK